MVNSNLLKAEIIKNGETQSSCAKSLGICKNTFTNKISGKSSFTLPEIIKLINFLKIDDDSLKCQIFLSSSSK